MNVESVKNGLKYRFFYLCIRNEQLDKLLGFGRGSDAFCLNGSFIHRFVVAARLELIADVERVLLEYAEAFAQLMDAVRLINAALRDVDGRRATDAG